VTTIVLCGGSGTRLWPLSRSKLPKQFLPLFNGRSLFTQTLCRNVPFSERILIVTNREHYFLALDQTETLENISFEPTFILEEEGKNTAAAIALAALECEEDEILFVTPSDHLIKADESYDEALREARRLAKEGYLVTFGIEPTFAHTGYGYIEADGNDVLRFCEKPDKATAEKFVEAGNFFWNSGMFMFQARSILEALRTHAPELYEESLRVHRHKRRDGEHLIHLRRMQALKDISIDYAVMEKSDRVKVIPARFSWSDVGSFDELSRHLSSDDVVEIEAEGTFVLQRNRDKTVAVVGTNDLHVIDTPDALLIAKKGKSQSVKKAVERLKTLRAEVLQSHTTVHRPWGTYEVLVQADGYKIKRITVKPGERLSLQKHFHRSEHWVVVRGTAQVQVGNETFLVRPNESTYIKAGELHRLSNPGKVPVVLIEAQVGEYVGEDDIVRVEDDYARDNKGV
jgi:mannose-1-phosphate guanylyltransferase